MSPDVLAAARELVDRGRRGVLATVVWRRAPSSGKVGSRAIIHPDGRLEGWIGGACAEPTVVRQAAEVLAEGSSRLLHLGPPEELPDPPPDGTVCVPISCESDGSLQIFLEPLIPAPHLVVVGRTVAVGTLVAMAEALSWRVTAVDPDADRGADLAAAGGTADSMIVVATQGHHDEETLEAALTTDAAYIGLVASHRRAERVRRYLRDRGVPEEDLARVRAPAGLDLGPTSHEEIAVSVLAELVALRASGELRGEQPGDVDADTPDETIDPVCGMVVRADSRFRAEHAGESYAFCCPACRVRFEEDPTAYIAVDA